MKARKTEIPYNALIDAYEPGMTAERIGVLFDELQEGIRTLLTKIQESSKQPDVSILNRSVPVEAQNKISTALAESVGIDVSSPQAFSRIDETRGNAYTLGFYDDVRITTRYTENSFYSSITGTLHESGHALYFRNLNPEWQYQPVGNYCSGGFSESQSRTIEILIGRSKDFWAYSCLS